jgi:hypothetical protein
MGHEFPLFIDVGIQWVTIVFGTYVAATTLHEGIACLSIAHSNSKYPEIILDKRHSGCEWRSGS